MRVRSPPPAMVRFDLLASDFVPPRLDEAWSIRETSRRGGAGLGLLTGAPIPSRKPDLRIGDNLGEPLLPCCLSDRYGIPYTSSLLMVAGTEAKHSKPCRERSDHAMGVLKQES
jgi:hypothetical protein